MVSKSTSVHKGHAKRNGCLSPEKIKKQPVNRFRRLMTTFTVTAMLLAPASGLHAQVTVGSADSPQQFSVLELIGDGTKGLRLPQMSEAKRDEMTATAEFAAEKIKKALGLQIFNTTTRCVNTWNGNMWIEICPPEGRYIPPESVAPPSNCKITASADKKTFNTVKDPYAEAYEFFLNNVSQGLQSNFTITFPDPHELSEISVKCWYLPSVLKPKMIDIQGGTFAFGSAVQESAAEDGQGTPFPGSGNDNTYTVTLSSFKMSETLITQAQYIKVVGDQASHFQCRKDGLLVGDFDYPQVLSRPVDHVNWFDAIIFCNKLSIADGKTPCYSITGKYTAADLAGFIFQDTRVPRESSHADLATWNANVVCDWTADGYRLPTEAEWEYAARGGQQSLAIQSGGVQKDYHYAGSNKANDVVWHKTNCGDPVMTQAVKTKAPNDLGLYDMSGNVMEWCWDWFNLLYNTSDLADPKGPTTVTSGRAMRSTTISWDPSFGRVTWRFATPPYELLSGMFWYYGFRVVTKQ